MKYWTGPYTNIIDKNKNNTKDFLWLHDIVSRVLRISSIAVIMAVM